jgi:phosphatidylglycerophosphate synthase
MMPSRTFRDYWEQKYASTGNYFFTRVISQRLGALLAFAADRAGFGPNAVTLLGLVVMLSASLALAYAPAGVGFVVLSAVLYQLGFALDCADGQLARATARTSAYGAWLDLAADHVRQVGILLAISVNFILQSDPSLPVAFLSLFLLGSGLTVSLHTVTVLKSGEFRPHGLTGIGSLIKSLVKEFGDTPLFLLMVCVLTVFPTLLAAYVALLGTAYLAQAIAQAGYRIR